MPNFINICPLNRKSPNGEDGGSPCGFKALKNLYSGNALTFTKKTTKKKHKNAALVQKKKKPTLIFPHLEESF